MISKQLIFWFIWKHDTWNDNTKKWRACFLVWCFQTHHRNNIHFFCESIFVCIDCHCLLYLTVRICRAILMTMFFWLQLKHSFFVRWVFHSSDLIKTYCVQTVLIFMKSCVEISKFKNAETINWEFYWAFDCWYCEAWLRWKFSSIC